MENRKYLTTYYLFLILTIALFCAFFVRKTRAYSEDTHAFLLNETIKFYNAYFPDQKVADAYRDFFADGVRHEDTTPRYLNHFYDPVNNRGLADGIYRGEKSKTWAQNDEKQNSLAYKLFSKSKSSTLTASQLQAIGPAVNDTDFTWKKAIDYYANGQKEQAFYTLGHVIHLIEDSSVPDHVRNDSHPPFDEGGSPYENWTSRFTMQNPDKNLSKNLAGKKMYFFDNLSEYFDEIATYTNNNFYSRDTINKYSLPKVENIQKIGDYQYMFGKDEDGQEHYLGIMTGSGDFDYTHTKASAILLEEVTDEFRVLPDYWSRLSTKSIQYGAGVIKLFIDEAEKAKAKLALDKARRPYLGLLASGIRSIFGGGNNSGISLDIQAAPIQTITPRPPVSATPIIVRVTSSPKPTNTPSETPEQSPIISATPSVSVSSTNQPTSSPSPTPSPSTITYGGGGGSSSQQTPTPNPTQTSDNISTTPTPIPEPTPTLSPTPQPLTNSNINHVLISEIQMSGTDAGDEFIELYNPTETEADLSSWSIQYASGTATSSENIYKKNFEDNSKISPKGYFLIARGKNSSAKDGYTGPATADLSHRSFSLSDKSAGGKIFLVNNKKSIDDFNDTRIVDAVNYAGIVPLDGQSIERKSFSNSACTSSQNEGQYQGNGCDTDDNSDFEVRVIPNPQTSHNLPEPRPAPANVTKLDIAYDPTKLKLSFNWDKSISDIASPAQNLTYRIFEDTGNTPAILSESASQSFSKQINEVGRKYKFGIKTIDREGLASEPLAAEIDIPSFLNSLNFYQDPLTKTVSAQFEPLAPKYLLDMSWPQYPPAPVRLTHLASGQISLNNWQIIVLYYNSEAQVTDDIFWEERPDTEYKYWGLSVPKGLKIKYQKCLGYGYFTTGSSLILPETVGDCSPLTDNYSASALDFGQLEDMGITVEAIPENFSTQPTGPIEQDYISVAFYGYQPGYEPNGHAIRLLAVDKTKYYFQTSPSAHQPPTTPKNLTTDFSSETSILKISWSRSTDPDSLDNLVNYEIKYAGQSKITADNYFQLPVESGTDYSFEILAFDPDGNFSEPSTVTFVVPLPAN